MAERFTTDEKKRSSEELHNRDGAGQGEAKDRMVKASCVVCGGRLTAKGYKPEYRDCCSWSCCRDYYS